MRLYHNYKLWEDYKSGFYEIIQGPEREIKINHALGLFNSEELTTKFMNKVINEWPYSCDQFLSNIHINRIAYIGQAACCIFKEVPNLVTMEAWNMLSNPIQKRSDSIAFSVLKQWRQNIRLNHISRDGKPKDIKQGCQMRLPFN